MRQKNYLVLLLIAVFVVASGTVTAQEEVNLLFTFWGTGHEKDIVEEATAQYMEMHPNVHIEARYIPNAGYEETILSMVAAGDPPDMAYVWENTAAELAASNRLLDLTPYLANDPNAQYAPWCQYHFNGRYIGDCIAGEMIVLYYNRDLFDAAGLPYPPSRPEDAWTWDEFLNVAKQMTKDRAGNDANSPDFNPDDIATFGLQFWPDTGLLEIVSRMTGNGAIVNEDGTALDIDSPDLMDGLVKFRDLMFVHHVSPLPGALTTLPSTQVGLQTGQIAMVIDGHWKVLDYSRTDGLNWGMAVFPKFKQTATTIGVAPMVIFEATEHPEEVVEFYKYLRDPASVSLYSQGLWMPILQDYYTDEDKISAWLDGIPGVYPPEARDVLIGMANCCVEPPTSVFWVKDWVTVDGNAVYPRMQPFWLNEESIETAVAATTEAAAPLFQGLSN